MNREVMVLIFNSIGLSWNFRDQF